MRVKSHYFFFALFLPLAVVLAKADFRGLVSLYASGELVHLVTFSTFVGVSAYLCMQKPNASQWLLFALISLLAYLFGPAPLLSVASILLVMFAIGDSLIRRFGRAGIAFPVMQICVGLWVCIGTLQAAIHFPIISDELIVCGLLAGAFWGRRSIAYAGQYWRRIPKQIPRELRIPAVLGSIVFAVLAVFASYREVYSDALLANLNIAHQVSVRGQWSFDVASHGWAVWPKGAAWLYSLAYILAGEKAARLLNLSFLGLTALLVMLAGYRLSRHRVGACWAAVLLLACPLTAWLDFVLFDDALLALFVTALIVCATYWGETTSKRFLLLTIVFASAALTVKISAVIPVAVSAVICIPGVVRVWQRGGLKEMVWPVVPWAVIAGIVGLMPYIYAFMATGNPVFPLYNALFKSPYFPPVDFADLRWSKGLSLSLIYHMTFDSPSFMEGRQGAFGYQVFSLLPAVLLAAISAGERRTLYGLLIVVLLFYLIMLPTQYARYAYPVFPWFFVCVATVWKVISIDILRKTLVGCMTFLVLLNLSNFKSLHQFYSFEVPLPFTEIGGSRQVTVPEIELNHIVNSSFGSGAVVLYLLEPYGYQLDGKSLGVKWDTPSRLADVMRVQTAEDLVRFIKLHKITHVVSATSSGDVPESARAFSRGLPEVGQRLATRGNRELWTFDLLPAEIGETIQFSESNQAAVELVRGFHSREVWGVWANSDFARMRIKVPSKGGKLRLSGVAMPYVPKDGEGSVQVGLKCNGIECGTIVFSNKQQAQDWAVDIPEAALREDGVMTLDFSFPLAFDSSSLRVGFYRMMFTLRNS